MAHAVEHVRRAEVLRRATRVDEAGRLEAVFLEEDETDAPAVLVDELAAVTAARTTRGCPVDFVDPGHAAMGDTELGGRSERLSREHPVGRNVARTFM